MVRSLSCSQQTMRDTYHTHALYLWPSNPSISMNLHRKQHYNDFFVFFISLPLSPFGFFRFFLTFVFVFHLHICYFGSLVSSRVSFWKQCANVYVNSTYVWLKDNVSVFVVVVDGGESEFRNKRQAIRKTRSCQQTDRQAQHIYWCDFLFPACECSKQFQKLVKIIRQTYRLFLSVHNLVPSST